MKHGIDFGKRFVCPECQEVLPSNVRLKAHRRRQHDNVPSTCDICNKVLKGKAALRKHLKNAHFRTDPQVCVCDFFEKVANNLSTFVVGCYVGTLLD